MMGEHATRKGQAVFKGKMSDFTKNVRKAKFASALVEKTNPILNLGSEAEATASALKIAHKRGGWKEVGRSLKVLAPAYGTYASRAAVVGGAAYGGYHAIQAIRKKLKSRDR